MNYFPMFLDIKDKEVLICGGGKHALEKVQRLQPFGARLRIVSESISPRLEELEKQGHITVEKRRFAEGDLENFPAFVVAAEDRAENERIAAVCRSVHIPVNAVDMQDICDFIFPAMLASEQLCIGISTGGASPAAAVELKKRILDTAIPENADEILLWMGEIRDSIRERVPDREKQKQLFRRIVQKAFQEERPLTEGEIRGLW